MVLKIAKPPRDKDSIMGLSWQCCSWMVSVSRLPFDKLTPLRHGSLLAVLLLDGFGKPLIIWKTGPPFPFLGTKIHHGSLQCCSGMVSKFDPPFLHCYTVYIKTKLAIFTSTAGMSLTFFTVYFLKIFFCSHPFSFDFSPLTQLFLRPYLFALLYF